ncbi:MAG: hypothetical protein RJA99_4931 [Pseudomonadota bacterium]|jgi:hypothetical protein
MASNRPVRFHAGMLGVSLSCLLAASCGGGGSDGSSSGTGGGSATATATTLDTASVAKAIPDISQLVPVCRPANADAAQGVKSLAVGNSPWIARLTSLREMSKGRGMPVSTKALGPTKPADTLGDCGGRRGYTDYAHSNGVTTGTYVFDGYCTADSSTGERQVVSGTMTFVNTGTPSASGPITTKVEANSPGGLTMRTQDAAGKPLRTQVIAFTNFLYAVGVPGGTPTASKPNVLRADELRYTDAAGQTYRESNYALTQWNTADGSEQMTISGRGYRSNGDWFDVSTPTPVTSDASGRTTAGQIVITGAGDSKAVMTMVPGTTTQATMTVNGTPVTAVPVCK